MTVRLGTNDILEYNPQFQVLICRECQYAIQTSAISSHLLRHKIYRGDRQSLMALVAELHLLEPDDVPLPEPASSPVQSLPVISGYCCSSPGCGNLCASTKRMKRHWSEAHDLADSSSITSAALARPAALQTFFRGTKLRYFEVTPVDDTPNGDTNIVIDHTKSSDQSNGASGSSGYGTEKPRPDVYQGDGMESLCSLQQLSQLTATCEPFDGKRDSEVPLDLVAMRYFHHFTTVTSHVALPPMHGAQNGHYFWREHVIHQALQWPWLMYGVLATSAAHSVSVETQILALQNHLERWNHYTEIFLHRQRLINARHEEKVSRDAVIVGRRIEALLCCLRHIIHGNVPVGSSIQNGSPCRFLELMTSIKDLAPDSENHAENTVSLSSHDSLPKTHPRVLEVLHLLPSRMALILGKPRKISDVSVALSGINSLIDCCEISFSCDDFDTVWQGMTRWLVTLSDHFEHMLLRHEPAALVVLAYWATFLVRRVELCEGWFLKGAAKLILADVVEQLPHGESASKDLVEFPFGTQT